MNLVSCETIFNENCLGLRKQRDRKSDDRAVDELSAIKRFVLSERLSVDLENGLRTVARYHHHLHPCIISIPIDRLRFKS